MCEDECPSSPPVCVVPVVPLPVALYVSNGLIFELYDGGQPSRTFVITWEQLKPTGGTEKNT